MALLYRQRHGLAMALAAMWSGSAALAQPGGLYLNSPLSLSAGRDSGFLVGAAAESDEVALISMPEGLLLKATPRLNVSIKYRPEFEIFAGRRNLDSWNHHAGLQLSYRATPRAYVEIGDSFLATNDPDRQFAETLVHLPRGNFKENSFYFDAGYSLSPVTTVDVRFDNGVTTSNFLGAARIGFFDHVTYAGTAGIARIFGPKHRLSASYSYVDLRLLDAGNRDVPESAEFIRPAHSLTGGYRYSSNPGLAVTVSGGAIRYSRYSYSFSGQIEKRAGQVWFSAGYLRYLSFFEGLSPAAGQPAAPRFPNGVLPSSLFQGATTGATGKLTSRIGFALKAARAVNTLPAGSHNLKGVSGHLRLEYKLTERLTIFSVLEYYGQNLNELVNVPLVRKRYFAGLDIAISRAADAVERQRESERMPAASRAGGEEPYDNTDH